MLCWLLITIFVILGQWQEQGEREDTSSFFLIATTSIVHDYKLECMRFSTFFNSLDDFDLLATYLTLQHITILRISYNLLWERSQLESKWDYNQLRTYLP